MSRAKHSVTQQVRIKISLKIIEKIKRRYKNKSSKWFKRRYWRQRSSAVCPCYCFGTDGCCFHRQPRVLRIIICSCICVSVCAYKHGIFLEREFTFIARGKRSPLSGTRRTEEHILCDSGKTSVEPYELAALGRPRSPSSPQTSAGAPGWRRPPQGWERCSTLPPPGSAACTWERQKQHFLLYFFFMTPCVLEICPLSTAWWPETYGTICRQAHM